MARVWIDGFESGSLDGYDEIVSCSVLTQTGMDGSYCMSSSSGNVGVVKSISAASEYYFAFWFYYAAGASRNVFQTYYGATALLHLDTSDFGSYGLLVAKDGANNVLGTGTTHINNSTWYKIGIYIKIDDTAGRFQVVVNGVTEIDFTGDTKSDTNTTLNKCKLGCYASKFDNFIIDDAVMPTETRIQGIKPTAAGNSTQYDPSTGANYTCVDEVPPSDTDYVSTNTANEIDTYTMANLTGSVADIKVIRIQGRGWKEGGTSVPNIALVTRVNSIDYAGSDQALTTVAANYSSLLVVNPNTSVAWTEAEINALEIGVKSRS